VMFYGFPVEMAMKFLLLHWDMHIRNMEPLQLSNPGQALSAPWKCKTLLIQSLRWSVTLNANWRLIYPQSII
jgi:hypothetical protein